MSDSDSRNVRKDAYLKVEFLDFGLKFVHSSVGAEILCEIISLAILK